MIEQNIEQNMIQQLQTAIEQCGCSERTQVLGVWSPAVADVLKSFEETSPYNYVTVKVFPRQYDTPTIPTAIVRIDLTLNSKYDVDGTGTDYYALSNAIMSLMQRWQIDCSAVCDAFTSEGFSPVGFRIASGDCGVDKQNGTWSFMTSVEVHGVIEVE